MQSLGLTKEEMKLRIAERERKRRKDNPEKYKEYERRRHVRDRVKRLAGHKIWREKNKQLAYEISHRVMARVDAIKTTNPCVDCGHRFPPECMDFDHRPGVDKFDEVSHLVVGRYAWEKIEEEIAKCDIVCANCHRTRTKRRAFEKRLRKVA